MHFIVALCIKCAVEWNFFIHVQASARSSLYHGLFFFRHSAPAGKIRDPHPLRKQADIFLSRPIRARYSVAACQNRIFLYCKSQLESMGGGAMRHLARLHAQLRVGVALIRAGRKAKQSFELVPLPTAFSRCFKVVVQFSVSVEITTLWSQDSPFKCIFPC